MNDLSNVGDLTQMAKDIENIISDKFSLSERPAVIVSFTLPQDYAEVHWVINTGRPEAIKILKGVITKMQIQSN